MKYAKLIVPMLDERGHDLFLQHEQLKYDLLTRWGGYVAHEAGATWKTKHGKTVAERVRTYEIAIPNQDTPALRDLAAALAKACAIEFVIIVTPKGEVERVHQPPREK